MRHMVVPPVYESGTAWATEPRMARKTDMGPKVPNMRGVYPMELQHWGYLDDIMTGSRSVNIDFILLGTPCNVGDSGHHSHDSSRYESQERVVERCGFAILQLSPFRYSVPSRGLGSACSA